MKPLHIFDHFKILKSRTYLLYFIGQLISMSGSFMQAVVQSWLVYKISDSSLWLGIIAFLTQFPSFLSSPFAGVLADQRDKRNILIGVQIVGMIQAGLLAILTLQGSIQIWQIASLAAILGITNAFDMTTRHSFAIEMVGKRDLPSAIALNSLIINSSKIVGPALAGLLIGLIGEGWCFALNSISYIAVILSLLQFKKSTRAFSRRLVIFSSLKEGILYVKRMPALHFPLAFATFLGFVGAPYIVLLPVYAKDILKGGAENLGWLTAFHSVGALVGAFLSVDPIPKVDVRKTLTNRLLAFSVCMIVFGLSTNLVLSSIAIMGCGYFIIGCYPLINNSLQFLVADEMRSRVLSIYTMTFLGTLPLGGLLAGSLAQNWGATVVLSLFSALCLVVGLRLSFQIRSL